LFLPFCFPSFYASVVFPFSVLTYFRCLFVSSLYYCPNSLILKNKMKPLKPFFSFSLYTSQYVYETNAIILFILRHSLRSIYRAYHIEGKQAISSSQNFLICSIFFLLGVHFFNISLLIFPIFYLLLLLHTSILQFSFLLSIFPISSYFPYFQQHFSFLSSLSVISLISRLFLQQFEAGFPAPTAVRLQFISSCVLVRNPLNVSLKQQNHCT
jgi:hypothetical protein